MMDTIERIDGKVVVNLRGLLQGEGAVVIVPQDAGVVYTQQAAGLSRIQVELEGWAIPTRVPRDIVFTESPSGRPPRHTCWNGFGSQMTPSDADWLQKLFEGPFGGGPYRLDRARAAHAMEGWLPVLVDVGGVDTQAWLAYENCH
ncbi:MAG TPA: DUF6210 family protein [Candidatus Xenobia bacterium]|jgi:hypothetical protein